MISWRETFLYRLYKADKLLFAGAIIYLLGIAYGWRMDREEFPFLLYGMYSLKEEPKESYSTYLVEINGREIQQFKLFNPKKELIMTTTAHAMGLFEYEMLERDKVNFGKWLLKYAGKESIVGQEVKIFKVNTLYDQGGNISVTSKKMVFNYAE